MGLKEKLIESLWGVLQELIDKYGNFIEKPNSLTAVYKAGESITDAIITRLRDYITSNLQPAIALGTNILLNQIFTDPNNITDDQIQEYVKKDTSLQSILNYTSNSYDESITGDIVNACTNPDFDNDAFNNLLSSLKISTTAPVSGPQFIAIANTNSDFHDTINTLRDSILSSSLTQNIHGSLPWVFLLISITLKVKEWLNQNEFPSKYRGKYLQRLLRIVSATLKTAAQTNSLIISNTIAQTQNDLNTFLDTFTDLTNSLINSLKSLDGAISATLLASLLYEANRTLLQDRSAVEFNQSISSILCPPETILPPSLSNDIQTQPISTDEIKGFSCPIPLDNYITPIIPLEQKIATFSCPVPQPTIASINLGPSSPSSPPLTTKALYKSSSKTTYYTIPEPGASLQPGTPLLTAGSSNTNNDTNAIIYSEVAGTLSSIDESKQEWIIDDISLPEQSPLEKVVDNLSNTYQQLSDTKEFLKNWYIDTTLPLILNASPMSDASISSEEYAKIIYTKGGAERRYKKAIKDKERLQKSYDKDVRDITGKDYVEKQAKNETLINIKMSLDTLEDVYYRNLAKIGQNSINQGKKTLTKESEFTLIDFYIELYDNLQESHQGSQDKEYKVNTPPEDKERINNDILTSFIKGINEILIQRYFIDGAKFELLTDKINDLCEELDQGLSKRPGDSRSYYEIATQYWEEIKVKRGRKREVTVKIGNTELLDSVSLWLSSLGTQTPNTPIKNALRDRIWSLFTTSQVIATKLVNNYTPDETPFEATRREANYITNFFRKLWRDKRNLPKKIDKLISTLDEISRSSIPPSIIYRDGKEYMLFGIGDERECPVPEGPNSPFSEYGYGDIEYWLKYCAYATLSSIASLPINWGTGVPPPVGPIPLPTVYIPIKAFSLTWGIMVIGVTITGIYPFPWIMVSNLSDEHHIPLIDPATVLRKEADKLKKELVERLSNFKSEMLQRAMDDVKEDVEFLTGEVVRIEETQAVLRVNKPKRDREEEAFGDRVKAMAAYATEVVVWNTTKVSLIEEKSGVKVKLFGAQTKWDILKKAQDGASKVKVVDVQTKAIELAENAIDKTFEVLKKTINSIDPFIAALPGATKPYTANFGFTLKNPKPIQEIADGLDDTIDNVLLAKIQAPFELEREDLMSADYGNIVDKSVVNGELYINTLAASSMLLRKSDPFPKYENLVAWNLPWTLKFLLPNWGIKGGMSYGIPGFGAFPV